MLYKKKEILDKPAPIIWKSRGELDPMEWPRPNWGIWSKRKRIELWEAAFLCFDIEPMKRSYQDIDHFDLHTIEIGVCLSQLKKDLFLKEYFSTPYTLAQGEVSTFDLVKLSELAKWAFDRGYGIPEELVELTRESNSKNNLFREKKDINLLPNKKQSKAYMNRLFLRHCILTKGIPPNIDSIWEYIINNAGKQNFLFMSADNRTALTINKQVVQRKNLANQLKRILIKLKN